MPMYSCICPVCRKRGTYMAKVADRANVPLCACGGQPFKAVDAPRVQADYEPYPCPITGKEIRGRRAHEENLARHGCRVYETGELDDHKREKEWQNEAFLDQMADAAAEAALALPPERFEQLSGELIAGAEAPLERHTL